MRRSLEQFLNATLRGNAEVRPELIVDETHPVDIRVLFRLSNRVALIEIKWLGNSKDKDGKTATCYSDSRARDGAKQLADYLDAYTRSDPSTVTVGYLVIIDARRKHHNPESDTLFIEEAMHYELKEITFDPEYHKIRDDFEQPIRMFACPAKT